MNPLMILKGAKVFVIVALLAYGVSFLKGCEETRIAERDAAIAANAEKVSAQANAAALAVANQQLEAITESYRKSVEEYAAAQRQAAESIAVIQTAQAEQKAMLEGDRLQKAIRGKRELVEKLSNKATKERFDEVENIFNTP